MNYTDLIKDKDKFLRSVRRTSVTLRDTGLISNEDILEIAFNETYPRVSLILITTKAKDGNTEKPILGGMGPNTDYLTQSKEVWRLLENSIYSEGINRVVISLTASTCLKQIPLNSEVQLFELAKNIEDQAISDLDRIMGLIVSTGVITVDQQIEEDEETGEPKLYISNELDITTLSKEDFDSIIRDSAKTDKARFKDRIYIPDNQVGICWISLTGTMLSGSVETGFFIKDGETTESLIESVAMSVNELSSRGSVSVIASPNRGASKLTNIEYRKRELYPEDELNRDKQLYFDMDVRLHNISFSTRSLSTTFNRELIVIKFYTFDNLSAPLSFYLKNKFSPNARPIEGLVYGTIPKYKALDNRGPHSLFLNVNKQSASADLLNRAEEINTFYFKLVEDQPIYRTFITVRSSSPVIEGVTSWQVQIEEQDTEQSIAFKILDSFYKHHEQCLLVGSMPQPNAVQIIPYTKSKYESRSVTDVINVPPFLEVATGNTMVPLTQYKADARSIVVKIVPDQTKSINDDATAPYGASTSTYRTLSQPMQNVYDRIGTIRRSKEERYKGGHWHDQ
jgi:hypothetical protein